jgi:hypothetical protein
MSPKPNEAEDELVDYDEEEVRFETTNGCAVSISSFTTAVGMAVHSTGLVYLFCCLLHNLFRIPFLL